MVNPGIARHGGGRCQGGLGSQPGRGDRERGVAHGEGTASLPLGRSTAAARAAPAAGSTQCQAWAAVTASKERPAGSQSSNFTTSVPVPAQPGLLGHPRVGVDAESLGDLPLQVRPTAGTRRGHQGLLRF